MAPTILNLLPNLPRQNPVEITLTVARATATYITAIDLSPTSTTFLSTPTAIPPLQSTSPTPPPIHSSDPTDNGKLVAGILVPVLGFLVILTLVWKCCFAPESAIHVHRSEMGRGRGGGGGYDGSESHGSGSYPDGFSETGYGDGNGSEGGVYNRGGGLRESEFGSLYCVSESGDGAEGIREPERVWIRGGGGREKVHGRRFGGGDEEEGGWDGGESGRGRGKRRVVVVREKKKKEKEKEKEKERGCFAWWCGSGKSRKGSGKRRKEYVDD